MTDTKKPNDLTVEDLRKSIPAHLFVRDEIRFLISLGFSLSFTILTGYLAYRFIPLSRYMIPIWILYAIVNGTISIGLWVLGHECGHGAFSSNKIANDVLGFILHSAYLVPYFGWQHSHYVHHSRTNHLDEGETHVPARKDAPGGKAYMKIKELIGADAFAIFNMSNILIIGWPAYLLFGATGGPARGFTSHFFVPNKLFPKEMLPKVILSNVGLLATIIGLYFWAQYTSFYQVLALYIGPYLIGNMWLTGYTYMHHTDAEVPHYDKTSWEWLKGALCTIDRAYPGFINALHFDIGSTHVLHHIFPQLPHYNAPVANEYLKKTLGDKYRYDSQNPLKSFYQSAQLPAVEHVGGGEWRFIKSDKAKMH
jgi:fatty acid desaturase